MTNNERALKIFEAIGTWQYTKGAAPTYDLTQPEDLEDVMTSFGDALCDLMHWCDAFGVDFGDVIEKAYSHYDREKDCEQCMLERELSKDIDEDEHSCSVA